MWEPETFICVSIDFSLEVAAWMQRGVWMDVCCQCKARTLLNICCIKCILCMAYKRPGVLLWLKIHLKMYFSISNISQTIIYLDSSNFSKHLLISGNTGCNIFVQILWKCLTLFLFSFKILLRIWNTACLCGLRG